MKRITIQGVPKRKRHRREQIQFILFSQKKRKKKERANCHAIKKATSVRSSQTKKGMGPFVVVVHQKDTGVWGGESKVYDSSQPTDKVLQGGTVERK